MDLQEETTELHEVYLKEDFFLKQKCSWYDYFLY